MALIELNGYTYITSNSEPKNGEWVVYGHPSHDIEDLLITKIEEWNYSNYKPYGVKHTEGYGEKEGYNRIEASDDPRLNLPMPQDH